MDESTGNEEGEEEREEREEAWDPLCDAEVDELHARQSSRRTEKRRETFSSLFTMRKFAGFKSPCTTRCS
eukprot:746230-Hanusia_phi.AAC.7